MRESSRIDPSVFIEKEKGERPRNSRPRCASRDELFTTMYLLCTSGLGLPNFADYANEFLSRCPWRLNESRRIISSPGKFGLHLVLGAPPLETSHLPAFPSRRAIKRHSSVSDATDSGDVPSIVISAHLCGTSPPLNKSIRTRSP